MNEINQCAIQYLVEQDIKVYNPYTTLLNPQLLNNRGIPTFINLVNTNAFYNYASRKKLKIGDETVVIGTLDDMKKVMRLWDINVQKDKLSSRQQQILNLPIPHWTLDEAMSHQEKTLNEYNIHDSASYREEIRRKEWNRERIAKEIEASINTIKFDLDVSKDDRTSKNLYEMNKIARYKFDENDSRSMWCYYIPKDENAKIVSNDDLMYWYTGTNEMYQSNQPLNDKKRALSYLIYRYNFIINERTMVYICDYCENSEDITLGDDAMFDFLEGFFEKYGEKLIKVSDKISMDNLLEHHKNIQEIYTPPTSYNNEDFVPMDNSPISDLNQNSSTNSMVQSNCTIRTINELQNRREFEELDEYDKNVLLNILDILPQGTCKTLNEIQKEYPFNPNGTDDHLILKLEKLLSDFVSKDLLHQCMKNNVYGYYI